MRALRLLALVVAVAPFCADLRADDDGVPIPGDDFVVTGTVKIKPGVYRIADANGDGVIHVKGDGTRLDLTGVTLIGAADDATPDSFTGVGVSVDGAKGVTITGGAVRGFKIGVRVHDSPAAKLAGIDASGNFKQHLRSTVEREDESDWLFGHENDDGHWERDYGAGVALKSSPGAIVVGCVVRGGQNGVLLDRCDRAQVYDGDFSFSSGWGIALWRTCDAIVCRNSADFCVRGYSHGKYARGQDSAGIFVFEQCSRNTFALNSATHGGDGFFLYAGNETLKKTGEGGCNENVVWKNDFSHAVANGIEATFSRGNRFVENLLMECEHGVWAGYSYETEIAHNEIAGCNNGVSIEHGHDNRIWRNSFEHCKLGLHLWANDNPGLAASAFGKKHDVGSCRNRIAQGNSFHLNDADVLLEDDLDSEVSECLFTGAPQADRRGRTRCAKWDLTSTIESAPTTTVPDASSLPGHRAPFRGRENNPDLCLIQIDEWGPVQPGASSAFPSFGQSVGDARVSVVGFTRTELAKKRGYFVGLSSFEVTSLTDGFVAEPTSGKTPATIVVHANAASTAPKPFELTVKVGNDMCTVRGSIASMPWDVSFFRWTKDPRTDADAWKALLAGEPIETRHVDGLDYDWKGGAVSEKVGADRFATLATSTVETTAGKWRLSTVSDDGIRVWVDGKLVVEDWTQHGPTPHDVDLDLAAGKHAIRVEHFEIDGWAALRVSLAPAAK